MERKGLKLAPLAPLSSQFKLQSFPPSLHDAPHSPFSLRSSLTVWARPGPQPIRGVNSSKETPHWWDRRLARGDGCGVIDGVHTPASTGPFSPSQSQKAAVRPFFDNRLFNRRDYVGSGSLRRNATSCTRASSDLRWTNFNNSNTLPCLPIIWNKRTTCFQQEMS